MYFSDIFTGFRIYMLYCIHANNHFVTVIVNVLPAHINNMLPVKLILFSELFENSGAVLRIELRGEKTIGKFIEKRMTDLKKCVKETPTLYMLTKPRYTKNTGVESFSHKCILILLK